MPKVSEDHRRARRAEIIDAALRCFHRQGYRRTSMADIITESGLSAGAIYGYFSGKQELLLAAAERVLTERQAEMAELERSPDPPAPYELMAGITTVLGEMDLSGVLVQVWGEAASDPEIRAMVNDVLGRVMTSVSGVLAAWSESHPDPGRPDAAAWATRVAPVMMALVQGYILQRAVFDDFDRAAYLEGVRLTLRAEAGRPDPSVG